MIRTITEALVLVALVVGAWWALSNKDADMRKISGEVVAIADSLAQTRREFATLLRQRDSLAIEAGRLDTVWLRSRTRFVNSRDSVLLDTTTSPEVRRVIAEADAAIAACDEFTSTCKAQVRTLEQALATQDSLGGLSARLAERQMQQYEHQVRKLKLITAASVAVAILAAIFR